MPSHFCPESFVIKVDQSAPIDLKVNSNVTGSVLAAVFATITSCNAVIQSRQIDFVVAKFASDISGGKPVYETNIFSGAVSPCGLQRCINRPAPFFWPIVVRRRIHQALSVLSLSLGLFECVCFAVN